jgi:hypothetical protein
MSKITTILRANLKMLLVVSVIPALAALTIVGSKTLGLTSGVSKETQKPVISFDPTRQKPMSVESESLSVSLDGAEPCQECLGKTSFAISIKNKSLGTIKTASLRNETAQVDEILIANPTRIVVLGSANGTVRSVNIINSDTGELVDSFLCSYPSLSKEGRFVAFVKAAAKSSSPEDWSYVYRVYDLGVAPAQNRNKGVDQDDDEAVGIQVYPLENPKRNNQTSKAASNAHLLASEALFWTDDEHLAFVDRYKKVNSLVVVDVGSGIDRSKVKTRALDTAKIVKKCGESDDSPENLINVVSISLSRGPKRSAHLVFQPMGQCLRQRNIDLPID